MRFRDLHINIRIRIFTSFLTRIVSTMIFPFMAIYFAEKIGQAAAGIVLLITVLTTMFTSFYGGYVADKIGRKKVIITSQIMLVIAFAIMAIANSSWVDSAWLTFAMMLLQSVSSGLLNPAVDAMLIDVSNKENRKFVYSINYWATNLSIAIGALCGGLFYREYRFQLFVVITCVSVFTLILFTFFMRESYQGKAAAITTRKVNVLKELIQNYQMVMSDRLFLMFCFAHLLVISLEFQTPNYISVRLQHEFGTQILQIADWFHFEVTGVRVFSIVQAENTVLVVLGTIFVTKWMRRFADLSVLNIGVCLYTLGYVVLSYNNSLMVLLLAMLVTTVGELMTYPLIQARLADVVKDDARSSYMAINGLVFQGARTLGAIGVTVGALVPSALMSTVYLMMGITGLALFHRVFAQLRQKQKQETVARTALPS